MSINQRHQSTSWSRRRYGTCFVATTMIAVGMPLAATPASAAINPIPVFPHSITSFPARDFISASGYSPGGTFTVNVVRQGFVIGTSESVASPDGMVEVNHPGGSCWEGVTPNIRAGDVIQVLTGADAGDQTTTANVTVTQPATLTPTGTIEVKGNAIAADGRQIPIGQLESRIRNPTLFENNGKGGNKLLATNLEYDGDGTGVAWTATFSNLSDGDKIKAVAGESRGMWLGNDPLSEAELTIFEVGPEVANGPSDNCPDSPAAVGPSTPDMTAATDSNVNTDNVTSNLKPIFEGLATAGAATAKLYVGGVLNGTGDVVAGRYSLTPDTSLLNGLNSITVGTVVAGVEAISNGSLAITVDNIAPLAPTVTGTVPALTGSSMAPFVKGTAEAGSTVSLFTNPSCTLPAAGGGSAAAFTSTGFSATVATGSTTAFSAKATDLAGNPSPCSASASYLQDSVSPASTTRSPAADATVVSQTADVTAGLSENVTGVNASTFTLWEGTTAIPADVTYGAQMATLNPLVTLSAGTRYTAVLSNGIMDAAGNRITQTSWSFSTGPRPTFASPTQTLSRTNASQLSSLRATFNRNVAGVNGSTFTLKKTSTGARVRAVVSYNANTRVAILNQSANLAPATRYTATLTSGIKDLAGNALTTKSWSFTTGPRPTVLRTSPASNTRAVSRFANTYAKFSENVRGISRTRFILRNTRTGARISASVSYNARTHIAKLNPSVKLAGNTRYTATLSSLIRDAEGNRLALKSWRFTTRR